MVGFVRFGALLVAQQAKQEESDEAYSETLTLATLARVFDSTQESALQHSSRYFRRHRNSSRVVHFSSGASFLLL